MTPRLLEKNIRKAAEQYPVITVTGPRQSGKTTLIRALFPDNEYVSLEEPELRQLASEDPRGFLAQFSGKNVILDEVQRTPDLFSYIQTRVDEVDRPGQFILSGSQNFLLMKNISQTLAGRCAVFHLMPFSLNELRQLPHPPIEDIGQNIPSIPEPENGKLFDYLFKGFYPRIHDKKLDAQEWLKNYTQTYIERDVRDLINIGDLESFRRFMGLCAGRVGQLLNLSSLASDCGITHTTAKRWLSVLETGFITTLLRPHYQNFNKRLVKSPKLYFLDTGLLCYLLRIRSPEDLLLNASRGAIFENYVVAELLKRRLHAGHEPDIYFWRDSTGHELDIIIDLGNRLIPVEVKSGHTIAKDFFKGLGFWKTLSNNTSVPAALIYAGNRSLYQLNTAVYSWWNF
ncbi:MAG: AAA family ATPase [Desulfobacterales bacterium CG23_combo_of_CG06-09_8_20_14_all_51_8]|nr:MAG: AAA family ATPase [Desulfobacterales bacterium CG23_combo_of_CG06-09_8_20_14_all_51_8]